MLKQEDRLYQVPYPILGLTGGIASGKSTVANDMREKGILVVSADELVKEIYQKKESIEFIKSLDEKFVVEGMIQFQLLRKWAFEDSHHLQTLENYLYPQMKNQFLASLTPQNKSWVVYDVPLLFEKGLDSQIDQTLVISVSSDVQISRLMERDKISKDDALKIIQSQMSIEEKCRRADFIIENNSNKSDLKIEVAEFLRIFKIS